MTGKKVQKTREGTSIGVAPPPLTPPAAPVSEVYVRDQKTPVTDVFYYTCSEHGQMPLPAGARHCPKCGSDITKVVFTPPSPPPAPQPIALSITVQAPPPAPTPQVSHPDPDPAPSSPSTVAQPVRPRVTAGRPRLPTNVEIVRDMLLGSESETPQERWERYLFYAGLTFFAALVVAAIGYMVIRYT